jgi:hypothetical protein
LWGMGDFSFIFAQLAPVPGPDMSGGGHNFGHNWPALRLQQADVLPRPGESCLAFPVSWRDSGCDI